MSGIENIRTFLASAPAGVKIVAISKTQTLETILSVYDTGHRIFGENKIQELEDKRNKLPEDIEWHMVGHMQSNKVKYIAPFISLIHSVDSLKLLEIINREGQKNARVIDILLQMHIAEEETKFGLDADEVNDLLISSHFLNLKNLRIRGLMGMATFTDNEKKIRSEFRNLVKIYNQIKESYFGNLDYFSEISMGMSNDYKIALEEGATIIRIGSLIFGDRNY